MKNSRRKEVSRVNIGGDEWLICEIYYSEAPRGYRASLQPWTIPGDGTRSTDLMSGCTVMLEPAPRFNARRLAALEIPPEVHAILREGVEKRKAQKEAQNRRWANEGRS